MPSSYLKVFKNIIFPSLCLCCETKIKQGHLCTGCKEKIIFLGPLLCRWCARPISEGKISCQRCQNKIYPYDRLISATAYREPMVSLIHLFKYKNFDWLGQFFSSLVLEHLKNIYFNPWGYDFIIPVPMHKYKLKKRGYNQSKLLAKLLSNHFKIPLRDDIINTVNIRPSQAKLQKQKRQENVEGIFTAKKDLTNKKIILIDDIFTTGSTAASCCQTLVKQNVSSTTVITLSRS
jgi:ComF family protein